ncbi:hypothetical protein [Tepidiforma sp.]|uniref:hypothetical protein n=1 Tax=Tepidiforma sp. TaxID=2682230 RepID=UPI002ADE49ED|nr:hypothetical protein [Tepidiforma sp.]
MNSFRFAITLAAILAAGVLLPGRGVAQLPALASASETTYRLDTAGGAIHATIEVEFLNQSGGPISEVSLFILPGALDVTVSAQGGAPQVAIQPGSEAERRAGIAVVTLPEPLKPKARTRLEASYRLAASTGPLITIEPGFIEVPFIGQGPGSWVFVDVPRSGDNTLDPGCLVAKDQPAEVKDAGLQRWVCGDVFAVALAAEDPDVLDRCAALDDRCRQRTEPGVFSAFALSVTDESRRGVLSEPVTMADGRQVTLSLKYFRRDQDWAQRQFAIARQAFPLLETLFGFPYPYADVTMRQSYHIASFGIAGVAFPTQGQVLLSHETGGVDEEVTIHELAHQWAGHQLARPFIWEGLAEWATRVIAPQLGVTTRPSSWQSAGVNYPLATWGVTMGGNPDYWYGRSGDFWFAYEAAIGGRQNMTTVLSRIDDEPARWPLKEGWFMDQGEFLAGRNLDQLFLDWVFVSETAKPLLAERRAAHHLVRGLRDRAAEAGLGSGIPSDIYNNLIAWVFEPVAAQVAEGDRIIESYRSVAAMAAAAGLSTTSAVADSWGKDRLSETARLIEDQRQAIVAITAAESELAGEPEDSPYREGLRKARELYAQGDFAGARSAASSGVTSRLNSEAAARMIELARQEQASFDPGFLARVGMLFTDPEGKLAEAEAALAAGDGTRALSLAREAYDTWDGASGRGLQRLAMLTAAMCALSFGVWTVLNRLNREPPPKKLGQGHVIEANARLGTWRDWEN